MTDRHTYIQTNIRSDNKAHSLRDVTQQTDGIAVAYTRYSYAVVRKNCLKEQIGNQGQKVDFWVAAIFLLLVLPLQRPRGPFLPYFCQFSPAIGTTYGTKLQMDFLAANHVRIVGLFGQNRNRK